MMSHFGGMFTQVSDTRRFHFPSDYRHTNSQSVGQCHASLITIEYLGYYQVLKYIFASVRERWRFTSVVQSRFHNQIYIR